MRILHYIESTDTQWGGVPKFVKDCARVMAEAGHPSTVLTLDPTDTPTEWLGDLGGRDGRPRVDKLAHPGLLGKLFSPSQMNDIRADLSRSDVVHLHCVWSPTTVQIGSACRALGVPYVVSCHGMLDDWSMNQGATKKRLFHTLSARMFLEGAARVHCTARAEFEQSHKWFPNGHEAIVPYLIDLAPFDTLPGAEMASQKFGLSKKDGRKTVLFLSRIHHKKGIEHLLNAALKMRSEGFRGEFIIAGTGDDSYVRTLHEASHAMRVDDSVRFVGQVKGQEKLSLYQAADLFVLPTSQENFGLVLVEALACGTPLVTTKGVDIWRDVEESGAARIVEDPSTQLAGVMGDVLSNDAALAEMSRRARPWALNTYDQARLTGRFEGMYTECIGAAPAGGRASAGWGTTAPVYANPE
jgi:glycosyltransferase involved in cell wall biosynthesis